MNRAERRRAHRQGNSNTNPLTAVWFSNAPWAPTGYGTQTAQVVARMRRDEHNIAVIANYGLEAMQTQWEGINIYPRGYESYSNDVVAADFADWKRQYPDGRPHVFVLFDAWTLNGPHWDELPVSIWTMVDHMPVPPEVLKRLMKPNITPIAVTRFGQDQIQRHDIESPYIPMAIDTNLYKPTEVFHNGDRDVTGRQLMGFDEDVFVVSLINANKGVVPSRKAWGENLLAFSIFAEDHPDARLYIHTERYGNHGGIKLDVLIKAVGLEEHQYKFVNQYALHSNIPNEAMAALYTASDVLLASTMGEGFGLTVIEAQSCGTPAIVNNFSAQPELVGDGWFTEGQPWWDPTQLAWFNTPNVPSIVDSLEQAYQRGRQRSEKARQHALQYDADLVWDQHWRPYLETL